MRQLQRTSLSTWGRYAHGADSALLVYNISNPQLQVILHINVSMLETVKQFQLTRLPREANCNTQLNQTISHCKACAQFGTHPMRMLGHRKVLAECNSPDMSWHTLQTHMQL